MAVRTQSWNVRNFQQEMYLALKEFHLLQSLNLPAFWVSALIPGFHLECACGFSPSYAFAAARVQPAAINNHGSSVSRFWQMLHFVCAQEHNAFIGNVIPFHCRFLVRMQPWSQQKYKLLPGGTFVL